MKPEKKAKILKKLAKRFMGAKLTGEEVATLASLMDSASWGTLDSALTWRDAPLGHEFWSGLDDKIDEKISPDATFKEMKAWLKEHKVVKTADPEPADPEPADPEPDGIEAVCKELNRVTCLPYWHRFDNETVSLSSTIANSNFIVDIGKVQEAMNSARSVMAPAYFELGYTDPDRIGFAVADMETTLKLLRALPSRKM